MPGRKAQPEAENRPMLPNYVREWRKKRKMTLEDLAAATGLAVSTLSEIERGAVDFTTKTLRQLAEALRCSPAALISGPPHDDDDFWTLWEQLGRQDRQKDATAVLKALMDTPKS